MANCFAGFSARHNSALPEEKLPARGPPSFLTDFLAPLFCRRSETVQSFAPSWEKHTATERRGYRDSAL
jgi:hypothetical protein